MMQSASCAQIRPRKNFAEYRSSLPPTPLNLQNGSKERTYLDGLEICDYAEATNWTSGKLLI
jgi:hypothetical protein